MGDVQDPQAPASRRHWKVDPASVELNAKLAEPVVDVPDGPDVIVVSGAVVSGGGFTVHVRVAGVGSGLPAASVARTAKIQTPSSSPV
jgi:hypothetical protein